MGVTYLFLSLSSSCDHLSPFFPVTTRHLFPMEEATSMISLMLPGPKMILPAVANSKRMVVDLLKMDYSL